MVEMQERIQTEMEEEGKRARKERGESPRSIVLDRILAYP
jgi:hypothetical protein